MPFSVVNKVVDIAFLLSIGLNSICSSYLSPYCHDLPCCFHCHAVATILSAHSPLCSENSACCSLRHNQYLGYHLACTTQGAVSSLLMSPAALPLFVLPLHCHSSKTSCEQLSHLAVDDDDDDLLAGSTLHNERYSSRLGLLA
jgi:hypothetical protein